MAIKWELWEFVTRIFKLQCCDCCLAHWISIPRHDDKAKAKIRFSRCERATAAARRGWSKEKRAAWERFIAIEK